MSRDLFSGHVREQDESVYYTCVCFACVRRSCCKREQKSRAAPRREGGSKELCSQTGVSAFTHGETGTPFGGRACDYDQANHASNLRYAVGLGREKKKKVPDEGNFPRDAPMCAPVRKASRGSRRNDLLTEMVNSDCMMNRDYEGWVDFGRRDAE